MTRGCCLGGGRDSWGGRAQQSPPPKQHPLVTTSPQGYSATVPDGSNADENNADDDNVDDDNIDSDNDGDNNIRCDHHSDECGNTYDVGIEDVRNRYREEDGRYVRNYLVLTKPFSARRLCSEVSVFVCSSGSFAQDSMDRLNLCTPLHESIKPLHRTSWID